MWAVGDAIVVLADNSGPLQLPDELIADLDEMQLPDEWWGLGA